MDNAPDTTLPLTPPEPTIPFTEIYSLLTTHLHSTGSLNLPPSHPTALQIMDHLTSLCLDRSMAERWDENFHKLRNHKSTHGNCVVENDEDLKEWTALQTECYRNYETSSTVHEGERMVNLSRERYLKLKNVGLTVNKWERRLMELRQHKLEMGHCDVPIDYPGVGLFVFSHCLAFYCLSSCTYVV
jgi:hypothetical protein